jgi:hypothetical protein
LQNHKAVILGIRLPGIYLGYKQESKTLKIDQLIHEVRLSESIPVIYNKIIYHSNSFWANHIHVCGVQLLNSCKYDEFLADPSDLKVTSEDGSGVEAYAEGS